MFWEPSVSTLICIFLVIVPVYFLTMHNSCTPLVNFFDTPQFLTTALHTNTVLSTPIYFFGLYIILTKTPLQMKEVKWYLVNLHVTIILFDYSISLLTMPLLLLPSFAGYPLGVLRHYGVSTIDQTLMVFALCGCKFRNLA